MVSVPLRGAPVAFASTVNCTLPLPAPLVPAVIVIHGTLLTAVHTQPPPEVTVTVPGPPATGTFCADGAMVKVHPLSCATVKVWPPTVIVPDRGAPGFAATVNCTVPLPVPL